MGSYKAELKRYSRKGIIKNTEWNLKLIEVYDIMKREYRIKNLLINIKCKVENCMKVIFRIASVDSNIDNYKNEKLNYNNYEKCQTEINMQRLKDRLMF